jgi:hypothetical protein
LNCCGWKNSCLEYGNIFVVAVTVAEIWKYQKSYINGLRFGYGLGLWWLSHFQQYFSYIVMVSYIGGGNGSTQRKPATCRK